jgi:hypothetical protein
MGYRSDVAIVFVTDTDDHMDEILAVYRMDPRVAAHKLEEKWVRQLHPHYAVLSRIEPDVKWYEDYDDVQGVLALRTVATEFAERRGIPFAWRFIRIGEDIADTEDEMLSSENVDVDASELVDYCWDVVGITRRINWSI